MRRSRAWASLAAAAVLLVSGCGSTTTRLTQAEFAGSAKGSCRSAAKALARLREPTSLAQFERTVNRAGFIVQRLYDDLTSLTPPERDAPRYKRFLALLGGDLRAVHAIERAVLDERFARLAGLQNGRLPAAESEARYAKALGIAPCAGVTAIEVPKPPKPRAQPSAGLPGTTLPARLQGPLDSSTRTEFVAGCSVYASGSACECLYSQLTGRYGINTGSKLLQLGDQTRRALAGGNPRALPSALKGAAVACRSKIRPGI